MNKSDVIAFYTTKEEYGCFSNFYRSKIYLDGFLWPTTEHFYQAQKAIDGKDKISIMYAATPKEAAMIGRSIPVRPDWEKIKYTVMLRAVRAKFRQHETLTRILLSTGDKEIVEWTEGTPLADAIWGNAKDKDGNPGQNLLGKVLMEVRAELKMDAFLQEKARLNI